MTDNLSEILANVASGILSPKEAEAILAKSADIGSACLDLQREQRCGFPEVIYGAGKTSEQILNIFNALRSSTDKPVFATRCNREKADFVLENLPDAIYHETAQIISVPGKPIDPTGLVGVLCAGTSDLGVAEEAALTAELLGAKVERAYDVGVSGLHRLLAHEDLLKKANVLIVVAGMDGALPSVVGGLTAAPVIAVPTSVGYGASFNGVSALLAMLNSCASGISVVNIDNGFGAGFMAAKINRRCK